MALMVIAAIEEIWLSKNKLSILPFITDLWQCYGYLAFYPSQASRSKFGETSLLKYGFKVNFEGSIQGDKIGIDFIVRNYINEFFGTASILKPPCHC